MRAFRSVSHADMRIVCVFLLVASWPPNPASARDNRGDDAWTFLHGVPENPCEHAEGGVGDVLAGRGERGAKQGAERRRRQKRREKEIAGVDFDHSIGEKWGKGETRGGDRG